MGTRFQVRLEGLRKSYAGREVLSLDSLSLESGISYALIGSNGSGKSTLLRAIAGTSSADAGRVEVEGGTHAGTLSLGYMPQKPYVFGYTVQRNVAMAVPAGSCSAEELSRRVEAALAAVGMDKMASAHGNTLSGGEAQRVALARILVRDLDVVLLDEPTASMDIEGTLQVEKALADYRARTGCLLLVATHAPAQAKRIAEVAIMLAEGQVVEQGSIDDVLTRPQSAPGRSFLSYWQL